jgi:hypothetical protein
MTTVCDNYATLLERRVGCFQKCLIFRNADMTEKEASTENNGQENNENNGDVNTDLESGIIRQVEYYFSKYFHIFFASTQ